MVICVEKASVDVGNGSVSYGDKEIKLIAFTALFTYIEWLKIDYHTFGKDVSIFEMPALYLYKCDWLVLFSSVCCSRDGLTTVMAELSDRTVGLPTFAGERNGCSIHLVRKILSGMLWETFPWTSLNWLLGREWESQSAWSRNLEKWFLSQGKKREVGEMVTEVRNEMCMEERWQRWNWWGGGDNRKVLYQFFMGIPSDMLLLSVNLVQWMAPPGEKFGE